MESFLQYIPDNESSVGRGSDDGGNNSSLCAGLTLLAAPSTVAAPTTKFQCSNCFCVFTSQAALKQHQVQANLLSCLAAKALFLKKLNQAQQQAGIPPPQPKRPYYDSHHQFEAASTPESHFMFLDTEEGSGTNDPFGDGNTTLDLCPVWTMILNILEMGKLIIPVEIKRKSIWN